MFVAHHNSELTVELNQSRSHTWVGRWNWLTLLSHNCSFQYVFFFLFLQFYCAEVTAECIHSMCSNFWLTWTQHNCLQTVNVSVSIRITISFIGQVCAHNKEFDSGSALRFLQLCNFFSCTYYQLLIFFRINVLKLLPMTLSYIIWY